jgi:hypothetical protein
VKTPEMEKAPVIAAMYGTFTTSESKAQEFWSHVAKGDLPDNTDPRAALSADLCRIKEQREPVGPGEYYAKCVKAWNVFRNGDTIKSGTINVNTKKGLPDIAA